MLVLPMRSPSTSPTRQRDPSPYSVRRPCREESPQSLELRKQVANTMLSALPSNPQPAAKRPKLSLQTSLPPSLHAPRAHQALFTASPQSPTAKNTQRNALANDPPPPTPTSAVKAFVQILSSAENTYTSPSSGASSTSSDSSSSPSKTLYTLPLGTRSILRNSPLPKRALSSFTAARTPKRVFVPTKRVSFSERTPDVVPTPNSEHFPEDAEDSSEPPKAAEDIAGEEETRKEQRRQAIQEEDGHSTTTVNDNNGRRKRAKRRREWVWRPLEEEETTEEGARQDDVIPTLSSKNPHLPELTTTTTITSSSTLVVAAVVVDVSKNETQEVIMKEAIDTPLPVPEPEEEELAVVLIPPVHDGEAAAEAAAVVVVGTDSCSAVDLGIL